MVYGWAGTTLEVDLSLGKIKREQIDPELYETYLGGKGIGAKLLWDRVPPETEPFSPDNLLIFGTGLLTGTPAPTASFSAVSFKSPQTNLASYSILGGFWAPELKHAGYDTIVVSGKSPTPVYLWIYNDEVEIRDAAHLWGKDTRETQRTMREELKNNKVQTVCIGPAGENKLHIATIEHSGSSSAGRTGSGAVMGDKNLKAIAVYGTKDVYIAKPAEFMELCEAILKRSEPLREWFGIKNWAPGYFQEHMDWGLYGNVDEMPVGLGFENYREISEDFVSKFLVRETACYNCPVKCQATVSLHDGNYLPVKCQAWMAFQLACKIPDLAFGAECYDLCTRYGLDYISTSRVLGFAIDLYQKGILTKGDTGGIHLEYGNKELAYTLIEKIAQREGLGHILADGTDEAAHMIGRGSERHAHLVKKLELMTDSMYNPYYAFVVATSDRADLHFGTTATEPSFWHMKRDTYIKEGWFLFPEEWGKYLDVDYSVDYNGLAEITNYGENIKTLTDLTGLCWFCAGFWPFPFLNLDVIVKLTAYATGMDIDEAELIKIARRVRTLHRANNVRLGIRRKDDTVPEKFFQEAVDDYQKAKGLLKLDHDKFDKELDNLYGIRGWNSEGIPTKETLDELSLSYVRQDLEQRRIL